MRKAMNRRLRNVSKSNLDEDEQSHETLLTEVASYLISLEDDQADSFEHYLAQIDEADGDKTQLAQLKAPEDGDMASVA